MNRATKMGKKAYREVVGADGEQLAPARTVTAVQYAFTARMHYCWLRLFTIKRHLTHRRYGCFKKLGGAL